MFLKEEISNILLNSNSLNQLISDLKKISSYGSNDQASWLLEDIRNISLIAKKGDYFYILESPYNDFEVFCIDVFSKKDRLSLKKDGFKFYKITKDWGNLMIKNNILAYIGLILIGTSTGLFASLLVNYPKETIEASAILFSLLSLYRLFIYIKKKSSYNNWYTI